MPGDATSGGFQPWTGDVLDTVARETELPLEFALLCNSESAAAGVEGVQLLRGRLRGSLSARAEGAVSVSGGGIPAGGGQAMSETPGEHGLGGWTKPRAFGDELLHFLWDLVIETPSSNWTSPGERV